MASPSILQCLHDTLSLKGYMRNVCSQVDICPEHSWILNDLVSSLPGGSKGVQSSVLAILAGTEMCGDGLVIAFQEKLKITLGADLFNAIHFQGDGFPKILQAFSGTSSYLRMC